MASIGAFLAADKQTLKFLRYNMRSQVFAKSLPMPLVVGNLKRLELLRTRPELKAKLWHNVNRLQYGLKANGFEIGTTNTPVTPVFMKGGLFDAMPDPTVEALKKINPDNLSPREALEQLYRLKEILNKGE